MAKERLIKGMVGSLYRKGATTIQKWSRVDMLPPEVPNILIG